MKSLGKIDISDLPPILQGVVKEGLEETELALTCDGSTTDLFIYLNRKTADTLRGQGAPFLVLDSSKKIRLGTLLKQMEQIVTEPSLYTDDFQAGGYIVFTQDKLLRGPKGETTLTDREVDILAYLARQKTRTATKESLLQDVWKYQPGVDTHTIETHIYRLRQKILSTGDEALLETDACGYFLKM